VDGTITGTRGPFLSIAGFRAEVVFEFTHGISANTVPMDGPDLTLILEGHVALKDASKLEIQQAGRAGAIDGPRPQRSSEAGVEPPGHGRLEGPWIRTTGAPERRGPLRDMPTEPAQSTSHPATAPGRGGHAGCSGSVLHSRTLRRRRAALRARSHRARTRNIRGRAPPYLRRVRSTSRFPGRPLG
jgi:hypothetical protein